MLLPSCKFIQKNNFEIFEWSQWTDFKPYELGTFRGTLYEDEWKSNSLT